MKELKNYQGDEGFLFEIINAVPSGIFVTDLDNNILIINRAGAELVGRTPGDCFDRKCYEVFNTPMCRTDQCTCKVATRTNSVNQGQTTLKVGDREIPIEFASRPVLSIRDSGPGIPPEIQEKFFKELVTTKPSGTGVGLIMVHHIMKEHQGEIEIEGRPGLGTTVKLVFPERWKEKSS